MTEVMMDSWPFLETLGLKPLSRGKVREMYDLGDGRLLMVATDRISVFDVVLPDGIPGKGIVLTQMSAFWFQQTAGIVPNHFIRLADGSAADELPFPLPRELIGRTMIVRKAHRIDIECVARGYISGSGWKDYQRSGRVCGVRLPKGLRESDLLLPGPMFTPSTKAEGGDHDVNITSERVVEMVGYRTERRLRVLTLALYASAAAHARSRDIIIADTKFEFGWADVVGLDELIVIDEMLPPDSSRFWPADEFKPGGPQPSFDKQYVRDYVTSIGWNKQPPAPEIPPDVVETTADKYREILYRLTGQRLN